MIDVTGYRQNNHICLCAKNQCACVYTLHRKDIQVVEVTPLTHSVIRQFPLPCNETEEEKRKVKGDLELQVLRKYKQKLYRINGRELESQKLKKKKKARFDEMEGRKKRRRKGRRDKTYVSID